MIDMRCALAPAGVSAWGALDMRPAAGGVAPSARPRYAAVRTMTPFDLTGTAVAAPTAPFQGTGLPTAAHVADLLGGRLIGTGVFGTDVFGTDVFGTDVFGTDVFGTDVPRTDTTDKQHTLGIHSPGRPQS
jgi:hypothetical protein